MIWIVGAVPFLVGLVLPTSTLSSGLDSLLVTFFGLLSASILPAISLLVGNVASPTYSLAKLEELEVQTKSLVKKLFSTLGVVIAGGALVMVAAAGLPSIPIPAWLPKWCTHLQEAPERLTQGVVFACFAISIDRLRVVSMAFQTVLKARFDLAKMETITRLKKAFPGSEEVRATFPTSEKFGSRVEVDVSRADTKE